MPKSLSKTPAPKKDRIYGSDKNKVGSASSKASAKGIELNESILATLSQKAKDYNQSHPKNKVSVATLKAVMRRGMGAYSTSHRPTITGGAPNSRQAWGFARVNKFLKKKAGQQVKAAYVQDDDLMADGGDVKKFAFIEKWEGGFYWLITKDGDNNYYNVDGDKKLSVVKDMAKRWGYNLVTKKQYEKMLSDSKLADGGETKKSKEAYTIVGVYTSTNDLGREESEDLTKEGLLGYRLRYNKMPTDYYGYVVYDDTESGLERAKGDYEKYNRGAAAEKERKKARDLENKIKREKQNIIDAQKLEAAKSDDTPKPAYLMTKSEYEDRVVPLLKEYEKFARKNDKYLSLTSYSGFYKVTFEQVLSRGLDGKKTGYYFRSNDEKQLIENWNERKFRKYDDFTIPAPTPKDVLEKNIAFFKDLNKFFDEKVIFDGLNSDYKKSNKSEIRRAIEDDTYKKMIENGEITEDEVIKIAEEQGVKVPKKVFSQESLLKKEAKKQMDEILSKIPKMNQDVFKSLYKQLFDDFKDVEKIVIERETERFEGLIKEYIELSQKEGGVNVEKLQTAIVFWRDIFIESQPRVVKTKDYRGYPIIENFYKDLELKSNYKPIMDKIILDYAESLKYRFLKAVLDNFPRVSKPISDVNRESLKVGKKGFEGRYRFNFADGSYFDFVTEAIPAAGYNIVSFHYRYITHLENATLADGTKIKGYYEIMQNFSSDSMADGGEIELLKVGQVLHLRRLPMYHRSGDLGKQREVNKKVVEVISKETRFDEDEPNEDNKLKTFYYFKADDNKKYDATFWGKYLVSVSNDNTRYESIDKMADGGSVGQEITCVNCGWHWNTSDSDESDKYVCHKCGFDNRTFYDPEPIGFMEDGGASDDFKRIKKEYLGIDESFEDTEYKYKDASIHYSKLDKLWILNMQHDGKPQKTIGGYKTLKAAKEVAIYYLSNPKMYADGGLIVSPTENLIESVRKEREKKIAEWYKLGSKIVVARNDGYSYKKESERDSDFFESKNPSQRKVLEIIKDNPDLTEISFNGTIKVGDKVGEELEIVDDFSVVLWKKDSSFFKEGLKFEFVNDNGKYINTIVNKNDTITYKDRKEDGNYIYIKQLDKKYGTISESRSRKDILKEEFDKQEAVFIKDNYADGGVTEDGVHLIIKNINKENMYGGTYKKIFDVIESDVEFYNPYGTEYEELKGNDLHIFITPRPDGHILEKIAKIKDVEFLDSKYADGGATDFGKVVSASSRFRPMETIVFDPPLVGLNGAKLISYTWSFQWETSFSKLEGEAISKRTSDWTQAEISAETGRDIVHKYTIQMPNGDLKVVSSDSVPILLGYTDRAQKSSFPNLSNAAKTLAKQKLQLSIIEAKAKEKADAIAEIVAKGIPEVRVEEGGLRGYKFIIGDSVCYGDDPNDKERLECPKDGYIRNRLKEMGIDAWRNYDTYDLKNRIERQERKIKDILNGKTTAEMGMELPSQHDLIKMELGLELFKPSKTIEQIAKEKDVPLDYAEEQLRKGMKTESEHSDNPIVQETIALQHLDEMIDYYDKLEYMESQNKMAKGDLLDNSLFNKALIYKSIKPIRQANEIIERLDYMEIQNKMAKGGVTEFYKQYQDWYKNGVSDKMTIMVSVPNAFSKMSSEDNHVILDVFEKRDESVDGKEKLKELLELADNSEIDVYLEPIPRHNKIKDEDKKKKITREYLISYYEKFGFELLPNGFMVRKHKNNKMEKGGYYKAGGEINPDDKNVKDYFSHGSGNVGGVLVGKRHSEGGIKAVNKSTNQPLEMEGGEVVITRNAVSDDTKREFEGKMMTNREILSKINESGGGVSFADGGDIPESIYTSGKEYKYGGKMMKDHEIVSSCGCKHSMAEGGITGDLHSLTDKLLAQKIEIFIKKVMPIKFYYIDEDSNSLIIGLDENYTTGMAEKLYKEATSSAEFFDADSVNMEYNQNTGQAQYSIKLKKVAKFGKGGKMAEVGETDYQTELKNHLFPKVEVEVQVEVEPEMDLMPDNEHYITADDLGLSDGMPMLAVGTIVYSSGGNDQWEVVSFSDDGVNLVNKPKSPLQSKMEDKHLTFDELIKYFKDKAISIKNISTERELEPAIALVKNKLPQKSFAVGGFIDGDEDEDAKIMQSQFGKSNFK